LGGIGAFGYAKKYASILRNDNTVDIKSFDGGEQRYCKNDFYLIFATIFALPKYGLAKWF